MHTGTTNYTDLEDILNKTQWNLSIPDTNGAKESVYFIVRWPHFRGRKRTTRGRTIRGAKESLYRWPHFRGRKRTIRAGKRCQRCPHFRVCVLIEGFYCTLSTKWLEVRTPTNLSSDSSTSSSVAIVTIPMATAQADPSCRLTTILSWSVRV